MKTLLLTLLYFLLIVSGSAQDDKSSARKRATSSQTSSQKPAVDPNAPPAGAEKLGESTWRHKDQQGKTWIYLRTPFGFMKVDEETHRRESRQRGSDQGQSQLIKVVAETSDSVTFETITPFGKQRWERKKGSLTASEKAALESSGQSSAPKE